MDNNNKKKKDKDDLINSLHPDLIQTILNKLPIKDAIKTSILSREWRYKWTTISELVVNRKDYMSQDSKSMKEDEENLFAKFITNYFFFHETSIHKFFFELDHSLFNKFDQWLQFLSMKGIKELSIDFRKEFWLSSSLFYCKELTYLELHNCRIENLPSSFKGFWFLKFLKLIEVSMSNYDSLISSCPCLESLEILWEKETTDITISAPNLKYLDLNGVFNYIYIEHAPLLNYVNISKSCSFYLDVQGSCKFEMFGRIPQLETLIILDDFAKDLSKYIERSSKNVCFNQLKFIEIWPICLIDTDNIRLLLRLIINSPNLETLSVFEEHRYHPSELGGRQHLEWRSIMKEEGLDKNYIFKKLKKVEVCDMLCFRIPKKLFLFILKRSPQLEEMNILFSSLERATSIRSFMVDFSRCNRASPKARLTFPYY